MCVRLCFFRERGLSSPERGGNNDSFPFFAFLIWLLLLLCLFVEVDFGCDKAEMARCFDRDDAPLLRCLLRDDDDDEYSFLESSFVARSGGRSRG